MLCAVTLFSFSGVARGFATYGMSWPGVVNYYIRNTNSDVGAGATTVAITAALAMWSSAIGVTFTQVFVDPIGGVPPAPNDMSNIANIPTGAITFEFAAQAGYTNLGACGGATTLGCGFFKGVGADITGGRVQIYDSNGGGDIQWSTAPGPGQVDIQTVLAHEIGHVIGMDHSAVAGALMFPTYTTGTQQHTLHADDIAGGTTLYGAASSTTPLPATWILLLIAAGAWYQKQKKQQEKISIPALNTANT